MSSSSASTGPSGPGAWFQRRPIALDIALVVVFSSWYLGPYMTPGSPTTDFLSYVMGAAAQEKVLTSPWSLPTWNPYLMCGRPVADFMSPFSLLSAPFGALDPIDRMKALLMVYEVLGGLAMLWFVRGLGAGKDAALFAGLVYPILPSHIVRMASYGHIHIVMFYMLAPLILLAVYRLQRHDYRGVLWLSLILALGFIRDMQRTLLLCVMLGVLLTLWLLVGVLWHIRSGQSGDVLRSRLWLPALFCGGFTLGVLNDAFELIDGFIGDTYTGEFIKSVDFYMKQWSVDSLYTYFDRAGQLGSSLGRLSDAFVATESRYLGVSLCLLALVGVGLPGLIRPWLQRFWLSLSLCVLSIWLAFGVAPVWDELKSNWLSLWRSDQLGWSLKLVGVSLLLALLGVLWVGLARTLEIERYRYLKTGLLLGLFLVLFVGTAPLPWLKRLVFFLRDFRNPDWIQVTAASLGLLTAGSLVIAGLARRFAERRWWPVVFVGLVTVVVIDLWPYRDTLSRGGHPAAWIAALKELHTKLGEQPGDFRVAPAESANEYADIGLAWHGKRMAWDFRAHTAPRRTAGFMKSLRSFYKSRRDRPLAASVAGLANIKYIIDFRRFEEEVAATRMPWRFQLKSLAVFENPAYRPWLQVYPEAQLMVGSSRSSAVRLAGHLSRYNIGLVHQDVSPELSSETLERFPVVYTDPDTAEEGLAPPGALVVDPDRLPRPQQRRFELEPTVDWKRPRPETIIIESNSQQDFFIVLSESFHPWWKLEIDGRPATLYPGSFAFLGILAPAGEHELTLHFRRPWGFYACALLSVVSTGLVVGLLVFGGTRLSGSGGPLLEPTQTMVEAPLEAQRPLRHRLVRGVIIGMLIATLGGVLAYRGLIWPSLMRVPEPPEWAHELQVLDAKQRR